jgi:hypothetical protein
VVFGFLGYIILDMPRAHEQPQNKSPHTDFLSYEQPERLALEASIRHKRQMGETLTPQEQEFYDVEHPFLTDGDQPYKH